MNRFAESVLMALMLVSIACTIPGLYTGALLAEWFAATFTHSPLWLALFIAPPLACVGCFAVLMHLVERRICAH